MLIFATAQGMQPYFSALKMNDDYIFLNLNSLLEGIPRLNLTVDKENIPRYDSKDFDMMYYTYIMNNKLAFMELMKVIIPIYEGKNVIIFVNSNIENNTISESLQKLIQQRYGLISYNISDPDDFNSIIDKSGFSIQGLYNLDIDKDRYSNVMVESYSTEELLRMQEQMNTSGI